MASPNTISGKFLVWAVESVVITGTQEWEVTETGDRLDGTTGADAGYENDDLGVFAAEMRATLVQNLSAGYYTQIAMGTVLTNVRCYRSYNDNQPAFYFPIMRVYESRNGGRVRDRFTVNITGRSNGIYYRYNPGAS